MYIGNVFYITHLTRHAGQFIQIVVLMPVVIVNIIMIVAFILLIIYQMYKYQVQMIDRDGDGDLSKKEAKAFFAEYHPMLGNLAWDYYDVVRVDDGDESIPYYEESKTVGWYLLADTQIQCFSGSHWRYVYVLAIPGILFYTIGIPLSNYMLLKRCEHFRNNRVFFSFFGFLYADYDPDTYYWESVVMMRKSLMLVVTILLKGVDTGQQILLMWGIILGALVTHLNVLPYKEDLVDAMEKYEGVPSRYHRQSKLELDGEIAEQLQKTNSQKLIDAASAKETLNEDEEEPGLDQFTDEDDDDLPDDEVQRLEAKFHKESAS
eukprot:gene33102-42319_t